MPPKSPKPPAPKSAAVVPTCDLLKALRCEPVQVAVAGLAYHVKPLTAADRLAVAAYRKEHGGESVYQILFARSLCDESGTRLLTDEDAATVPGLNGYVVDSIIARVIELNGLGDNAGNG